MRINKENLMSRIEATLETVRPFLQADGGDVELLDVSEDMVVKLKLLGACSNCDISHMTMKAGIEESIRKAIPEVSQVVAVD